MSQSKKDEVVALLQAAPPQGWRTAELAAQLKCRKSRAYKRAKNAGGHAVGGHMGLRWFAAPPENLEVAMSSIQDAVAARSATPGLRDRIKALLRAADPLLGMTASVELAQQLGCTRNTIVDNLRVLGAKRVSVGRRTRYFVALPADTSAAVALLVDAHKTRLGAGRPKAVKSPKAVKPPKMAKPPKVAKPARRKVTASDPAVEARILVALQTRRASTTDLRQMLAAPRDEVIAALKALRTRNQVFATGRDKRYALTPPPAAVKREVRQYHTDIRKAETVIPSHVRVTVLPGAERWDHQFEQGRDPSFRLFSALPIGQYLEPEHA